MVNPFNESNIDILKEAFPLMDISVIDDTLCSAKGDVNRTFEMLLAISDPTQSVSNGPPIPSRPSNNAYAELSNSPDVTRVTTATALKPLPNPFLTSTTINAKPLTVREELAQWRQDLREESKMKANNSRNSRNSSISAPNLALSNIFKSNSSRSSLNDRNNHSRENHYHNNYHASTMGSRSNYQRPLMPISSRSTSDVSSLQHSISTPNINYQTHSGSNGNNVTQASSAFRRSQPPPRTPNRHQSNSSLNMNNNTSSSHNTNPFLAPPNSNTNHAAARAANRRSVPNIPLPPRQPNRRESSENDTPSFNPFEEVEVPPPAYNEIYRDSVVNLVP